MPISSPGAGVAVRAPLDLSLYLVTDTVMCARVGVPATVAAAVAAGVTIVQLRDPAASDAELVALGRAVRAVLAGTGVPLVVNDRVDLVAAIGAQGAHVGQGDLDVGRARALLGGSGYLGLSVHSVEQVTAAMSCGTDSLDYLGVGPVWETSSKADAAPPEAWSACRRSPPPVRGRVSRSAGSPLPGSTRCARGGSPVSPSSARSADSRTSPRQHAGCEQRWISRGRPATSGEFARRRPGPPGPSRAARRAHERGCGNESTTGSPEHRRQ